MKRVLGLITLGLTVLAAAGAGTLESGVERMRRLPIQHNGRVKPFDSYAREVLWQITGESQIGRQDPVETVLSILADPDPWQEKPLLQVPFVPLRKTLEMNRRAGRISTSDLLSTRKLMKSLPAIVEKQQRGEKLTMLEDETLDLFNRFVTFSDLMGGKLHLVPPASAQDREWLEILRADGYSPEQRKMWVSEWEDLLGAWKKRDSSAFAQRVEELDRGLRRANPAQDAEPWRLQLEVAYHRWAPFRIAQWIYGLAALLLAVAVAESLREAAVLGFGLLTVGFGVQGIGIALRVILGGRPPVSNFYETMLWIPFVAVWIGLILERIYRGHYLALSASILAVLMLALSERVPLDSSLVPVVAVLRSNLWLTVHVLTIVASYGAIGLAGVLAHLYGWRTLAVSGHDPQLENLEIFLYHVIQVGVVLLAAGIMLGGVWANASWGRYWGWDPKETWALITLLWFLAVLHGRFAGWLRGVRLALGTLAGLFLLLMTYYGVSFYLVGLHSYAGGHAKPPPPLLIAFIVVELAFMALIGWWSWRRNPPGS